MAFVRTDTQDEEDGINAPGSSLLTPGVESSSSNAVAGPQQQQAAPQAKEARTGNSGTFVNLDRYLQANKAGADKLGTTIGAKVTDASTKAQNVLNTGVQNFNNQVRQNTSNYDNSLKSTVLKDPTAAYNNQGLMNAITGTYTGPTSLETSQGFAPITNTFNALNQTRESAGSTGGRKDLIGKLQTNTKRFTPGGVSFDNALVEGSQPAREAIKGALDSTANTSGLLSTASQQAAKQVADAQSKTTATGEKLRSDIGNTSTSLLSNLNAKATAEQKNITTQNQAALDAFNKGAKLNPSQKKLLGINDDQYKQILDQRGQLDNFGQDVSQFGKYAKLGDAPQISASQVASQQDIDRYNALNQLLGKTDYSLSPGEQGGYGKDILDLDVKGLLGAQGKVVTAQQKKAAEESAARIKAQQDSIAQAQQRVAAEAAAAKPKSGSAPLISPTITEPTNPIFTQLQNLLRAAGHAPTTATNAAVQAVNQVSPTAGNAIQQVVQAPQKAADTVTKAIKKVRF